MKFLKGWFNETLPTTYIYFGQLALLRMDGELFASTWDALTNLYNKIAIGGFIIVDDYGDWVGCRTAVNWFREFCGETALLTRHDALHTQKVKFAQWRKSKHCPLTREELENRRTSKEKEKNR